MRERQLIRTHGAHYDLVSKPFLGRYVCRFDYIVRDSIVGVTRDCLLKVHTQEEMASLKLCPAIGNKGFILSAWHYEEWLVKKYGKSVLIYNWDGPV